jgi:hypothetical protein
MTELAPGLYFGLPDETYHALPYLSSTGIKNLLVSPMDFWATSSMNPLYASMTKREESEAMKIGKAYHKRILEGADAFYENYCEEFDQESAAGSLKTADDMKEVLARFGLPQSGTKAVLKERIKSVAPGAEFYDDIYDMWYQDTAKDKIVLNADLIARIEIAAANIEKHPHLSKCFTGGYPEVSIIWEEEGITFKSRLDYLKPRAVIDLKTFDNSMKKPIDRAIYYAMASNKYHIQSAFYMNAAKKAVEMARAGKVIGIVDQDWVKKLCLTEEHDFYFVFQQKGLASVARGKKFGRGSMYGCGMQAIEDAIKIFKNNLAKYGSDPWVDDTEIDEFDDTQFPIWSTEL